MYFLRGLRRLRRESESPSRPLGRTGGRRMLLPASPPCAAVSSKKNRGTPKGCRSRFSAPIRPIRRTCSVSVKTWHKQVSWLAPRRSPRAFSEQKRSNDRLSSTGETSALTVAVPLGTCTRFSLIPPACYQQGETCACIHFKTIIECVFAFVNTVKDGRPTVKDGRPTAL